jgi:methyl-accepting chemotaxis protein
MQARSTMLKRILVAGVIPAVLVIVALLVVDSLQGTREVSEVQTRIALAEARAFAHAVESWNRKMFSIVEGLRQTAQSGLFGKRRESIQFLRAVLEENPEYEGVCFGYEADADGRDAREAGKVRSGASDALPAQSLDPDGRFIPYVFRDNRRGRSIELKPLSGWETDDWYQVPLRSHRSGRPERVFLTEPYDYEGVPMTTAVATLEIEGRFAGVAGLDLSLDTQRRELQAMADRTGLNAVLISSADNVVAAAVGDPMDDGALRRLAEASLLKSVGSSAWGDALRPLLASTDEASVAIAPNPATGRETLHVIVRAGSAGWRVMVEVPDATLNAQIRSEQLSDVALGAVGLGIMCLLLVRMAVKLSSRIRTVSGAARDVADGDLTRTYAVDGHDEASTLLSSMNDMTSRLNELVSRVRGVTLGITGTATELSGASRQQEEVAQSFGSSSAEIAAAVRQITTTGSELLRGMEQLSSAASDSARLATEGRQGLEEMGGTMSGLASATGSVASRLAAINEKAMSINAIVDTITKVADQTNLLSVNAAIEAEKAGESGRGFLVVAREIRRLADQTAAATLDIETTVRQMQGAVSGGVMEMDRFSEQVRRGVDTVGQVGQRLTQVIDRVGAVEGRFGEVTQGMQSQVQGAEQIRQSMDALAQNASRAREATREFAEASASLQDSLTQLRAAVNLFRLRDGAAASTIFRGTP